MIKVEMQENKETGTTAFAFECSSENDYNILDKLRVAIMGDHPKRGGYINSNRFVMEVKIETNEL